MLSHIATKKEENNNNNNRERKYMEELSSSLSLLYLVLKELGENLCPILVNMAFVL